MAVFSVNSSLSTIGMHCSLFSDQATSHQVMLVWSISMATWMVWPSQTSPQVTQILYVRMIKRITLFAVPSLGVLPVTQRGFLKSIVDIFHCHILSAITAWVVISQGFMWIKLLAQDITLIIDSRLKNLLFLSAHICVERNKRFLNVHGNCQGQLFRDSWLNREW